MALSLASRVTYWDHDRKVGVVHVQSSRCWYKVAIGVDSVTVVGPGVEEEYDRSDLAENLSTEGLALMVVLLFEETER